MLPSTQVQRPEMLTEDEIGVGVVNLLFTCDPSGNGVTTEVTGVETVNKYYDQKRSS